MAAVIKMAVLFVALAYFTYVCLETYRKYIPRIVIAESILDRYDYVVIGAGSAGCVLANRLTEDPEITVLLLEAGGDDSFDPEFVIPENGGSLWAPDHPLNWGYVTNPQRHSHQSMVGKRGFWPRGKALGGTSTINTLVYVRGDPADYDRWAEHGATGWAYEDVLPYFVKGIVHLCLFSLSSTPYLVYYIVIRNNAENDTRCVLCQSRSGSVVESDVSQDRAHQIQKFMYGMM